MPSVAAAWTASSAVSKAEKLGGRWTWVFSTVGGSDDRRRDVEGLDHGPHLVAMAQPMQTEMLPAAPSAASIVAIRLPPSPMEARISSSSGKGSWIAMCASSVSGAARGRPVGRGQPQPAAVPPARAATRASASPDAR